MTDSGSESRAVSTSVSASGLPPDILALIDLRLHRHQLFVEQYAVSGNAKRAAIAAGYSPQYAASNCAKLLRRPAIKAAVDRVRAALAERSKFGMDRAMAQLREDRQFAIDTENATAAVRASEIMAKLAGHLVDRIDARVQAIPFSIVIRGVDEPVPAIEDESGESRP